VLRIKFSPADASKSASSPSAKTLALIQKTTYHKMKRLLVVMTSAILISTASFGQKWITETICSSDTLRVNPLTIEPSLSLKYHRDSASVEPYSLVACRTRSNLGYRVEMAISNYYYGNKTSSWIGQHGGPNFNFILVVNKLNFGFRFKPWTIDPNKEIDFSGQTLPTTSKLNNIKLDYYVGYSLDFNKLISLEPYIGYNRTSFRAINEDELNQEFIFNKTGGLIGGATLNKYFKLKNYGYISVFGTGGYGFVDYKKVHPDLDNGYFEWNLGIAYKGFGTKRFHKKVE
jgi:opacity protein-like surface antigen